MPPTVILDKKEMNLIQRRLVAQILERHPEDESIFLVGIQRRGADLARRLAAIIEAEHGKAARLGALDINLYRDDWTSLSGSSPAIGVSSMPFSIDGQPIILVDDVLFTGRTARSALEALLDYGRPSKVELLVFIDRGHRELPICPDYAGRTIATERNHLVDVLFEERDGEDLVRVS